MGAILNFDAVQFERLGYFCPDPDSTPAGVQPHGRLARHLGQGVRWRLALTLTLPASGQ